MSEPAAISAQLVDMRNVGAHKSLKLTLHVPEEYALKAIEAFGWPTGANPVPVALARLVEEKPKPPAKVPTEKRLVQQAAIACSDPRFQTYLFGYLDAQEVERFKSREDAAAYYVRLFCGVKSRSEILLGTPASELWDNLWGKFLVWKQT